MTTSKNPIGQMSEAELHDAKSEALMGAQTITDATDSLNETQKRGFDGYMARANRINAELELRKPQERLVTSPVAHGDFDAHRHSTRHAGKLRAFKSEQEAHAAGMWLAGELFGSKQAQRWLADHPEVRALSGGINAAGGYLVPTSFEQAVIINREEYGVFRKHARVLPMDSDTLPVPVRNGGVSAYFTGENASITASDASWTNVTLNARKLAALTRMSSELSEDSLISMADYLADEMAWSFANKEDEAGFNGDGSDTYGGIVGIRPKLIDGTHTAGAVDAASAIDTFAEVVMLDLLNVKSVLPAYAMRDAAWYVSSAAHALVFERLAVAAGGNTLEAYSKGAELRFLGFPVRVSQVLPSTTGDLSNVAMILFGDLSKAALMGSRREVRVMVDESRYMDQDQIAVRSTERFDIVINDLGDTSTAGPIVGLIGE